MLTVFSLFAAGIFFRADVQAVNGSQLLPGRFGECGEGFARISYAYSVKHILEALEHIADFLDVLRAEGRGPAPTVL